MPGPFPGRVISVKSDKSVDISTGKANDEVVREMMARGMRALTGADHDARRVAALLRALGRRRHQGQLRRLSALHLRLRDRRRDRPPAPGHRRAGIADLPLRAFSKSARRVQLRAASSRGPADRRRRTRQPQHRQQRLRSGHLSRSGSLRGRRHAVQHDAAGVETADEDHQHPEHEGPRRDRRHRVPQEHRLRQLLQRRAHAPARQVAHLLRRRHAGRDRAAALEDRAADHGRAARRVAWRAIREDDAVRLLSAPDSVWHRSRRHRSPAARHHRGEAARRGRDLGLGSLAGLAEDGRHAGARMRIPTSTSSSGNRGTSNTPRRSASASTIARRFRCRT